MKLRHDRIGHDWSNPFCIKSTYEIIAKPDFKPGFKGLATPLIMVGKLFGAMALTTLLCCMAEANPHIRETKTGFELSPSEVTLTEGHRQVFSIGLGSGHPSGIVWRVLEPGGGWIDSSGNYQAPAIEGVYNVQASLEGSPGFLARAKVTIVPIPSSTISAPVLVLPDTENLTATVVPTHKATYYWVINGGRITRGKNRNRVTFQAGAGDHLELICKVTNLAGDSVWSRAKVQIAPPLGVTIRPKELSNPD